MRGRFFSKLLALLLICSLCVPSLTGVVSAFDYDGFDLGLVDYADTITHKVEPGVSLVSAILPDGEHLGSYEFVDGSTYPKYTASTKWESLYSEVRSYCCKALMESELSGGLSGFTLPEISVSYTTWSWHSFEEDPQNPGMPISEDGVAWIRRNLIPTGGYWNHSDSVPLTQATELLSAPVGVATTDPIFFSFKLGDMTVQLFAYYGEDWAYTYNQADLLLLPVHGSWSCRDTAKFGLDYKTGGRLSEYAFLQYQVDVYNILDDFLSGLEDAALYGLVAGSIGLGYNVATPYTTTQKPLSSIMEEVGSGLYDFTAGSAVKYSLSYYFSPFFGKLYPSGFEPDDGYAIPTTDEGWIELAKATQDEWLIGNGVVYREDFIQFAESLSEDVVNTRGEKIADVRIDSGAVKMTLGGSKEPKSVLSYNVRIALPYVWTVSNGVGRLMMNNLRILGDYEYCLYDDSIYPVGGTERLVCMSECGLPTDVNGSHRDFVYLYSQTSSGEDGSTSRVGVILPGRYHEAVVDTTVALNTGSATDENQGDPLCNNIYLTGRYLTFRGNYSDSLDFNKENVNVVSVAPSVEEGYLAKNIAFPGVTTELDIYNALQSMSLIVAESEPELFNFVMEHMQAPGRQEFFERFNDVGYHGEMPDGCHLVYTFMDFSAVATDISDGSTEQSSTGAVWRFFVVRNNAYIDDPSLLYWLQSDAADWLSGVYPDKLYAKITGDFTGKITGPTFQEWLKMQDIRDELDFYQSSKLMSVVRVAGIVLGTILMLLALLFMIGYLFDIWNNFVDISILQIISFGRLYAVSSEEIMDYLGADGGVKYVDFKRICLISAALLVSGFLIMNITTVVFFIMKLFYFFSGILGGKA